MTSLFTRRTLLQFLNVILLGFLVFVGAECGARVSDFMFERVPLLSVPSYADLWTDEAGVRHGRAQGRFKRMRFNNAGMQGPGIELDLPKRQGCLRIVFLGGSETFGRVDIEEGDYPSAVRKKLSANTCAEIFNASIPGMSVYAMISYWRLWVSKVHPDLVFIYPSTHFYLSTAAPGRTVPRGDAGDTGVKAQAQAAAVRPDDFGLLEVLRSFDRLKDAVEVPAPIQNMRRRRWLASQLEGYSSDWLFATPPPARADLLGQHLTSLVEAIAGSGAEPVLMTHAVRVTSPPRPEDHEDLFAMRTWTPRATEAALAAFPYLANEHIRAIARARNIPLLDCAANLSGKRNKFVDLVHFTQAGTDAIADFVVDLINTRVEASRKVPSTS
jgi:hypothetical protein